MDKLMIQIATNAAEYAVGRWGQNLPRAKQLALWKRFHDSSYVSFIAYHNLSQARRVRARAMVSEN
jgi:hypothetical protein